MRDCVMMLVDAELPHFLTGRAPSQRGQHATAAPATGVALFVGPMVAPCASCSVKSVTTKEESSRVSTTPVAPKIIIPLAQRLVQELVSSSTASLEVEELMRELAIEAEADAEPVVDGDAGASSPS